MRSEYMACIPPAPRMGPAAPARPHRMSPAAPACPRQPVHAVVATVTVSLRFRTTCGASWRPPPQLQHEPGLIPTTTRSARVWLTSSTLEAPDFETTLAPLTRMQ
jgi:hypothetical protein